MKKSSRYLFGEWSSAGSPLSALDVENICNSANEVRSLIADYPLDKVLAIFGRLKEKWSDPKYPLRVEAEETLPAATGFSRQMIALGMEELCFILDPANLKRKIATEFFGFPRSPDFHFDHATASQFSWHPLGTVLHVLSGNVFLVGPGSLIEGLLTGNVSILKNPSSEKTFLPLFIRSLEEVDHEKIVSRSIAVIDYDSSQKEVINAFKKRVDAIAIFGGESAVTAYRDSLPASTKLIVFGPKLSIGVCTQAGLEQQSPSEICDLIAEEIAIWDQNACTAPQTIFLEVPSEASRSGECCRKFADSLAKSLEKVAQKLPAGDVDINTAVEIQKIRSVAEVAEARDLGAVLGPTRTLDWTIIVESEPKLETSPLHRTIRILPFCSFDQIAELIAGLRGYIQTVGIAASLAEKLTMSHSLGSLGVLRIVDFGRMAGGEIDDPHDGAYDLPQFMHLVKTDLAKTKTALVGDFHPFDYLPHDQQSAIVDARFREIIADASRSLFYQKKLAGKHVASLKDLPKIAPLTRREFEDELHDHASPEEYSHGGYVTRSGGSTGTAKFSYFDRKSWDELVSHAVKMFRACGLRRGDRVANCFFAGDLYGSMVSFDHVNHALGLTCFNFADKTNASTFLEICKKFKINVLQGLPTFFMPLLREVHALDPGFRLEKILYAGQPLGRHNFDWLKTHLKVDRIASVIGTTEAGQLAYQCEHLDGTHLHHLLSEYNHIEITDEKGKPLPDGEAGFMLITTLTKTHVPLLRYQIGDSARLVKDHPCKCGRTTPVIEYLGRADDILAIGAMNVRYADIRRALDGLPIAEIQLVASFEKTKEVLIINAEIEEYSINKRLFVVF